MEVLMVLVLVSIIAVMVIPAAAGMMNSTRLNVGGRKLAALCGSARQLAMSKNSLTALVLLGNSGSEADYRTFTILTYDSHEGWKQDQSWERLPEGVVVDRDQWQESSLLENTDELPFVDSSFKLKTSAGEVGLEDCYARVFIPNGGLLSSDLPAKLRLVEGSYIDEKLRYYKVNSAGVTSNWFDVALIGSTGLTKLNRP